MRSCFVLYFRLALTAVVLYAVQTRYAQRKIYSYAGIVLLAVNPFEPVPMYTPEIVKAYVGRNKGELEPHLFAIAEDAYTAMLLDGTGQTIIVSGERYVEAVLVSDFN